LFRIPNDGITRDVESGGDIITIECGRMVHIFDPHN